MHPWARILTVALAFSVVVAVVIYFYSPPEDAACVERRFVSIQYENVLNQSQVQQALTQEGYAWDPGVADTANILPPEGENRQFVEGEYETGNTTAADGTGTVITFEATEQYAESVDAQDAVNEVAKDAAAIVNATFPAEERRIGTWIQGSHSVC